MATLTRDKNGRYVVQAKIAGKRETIGLGPLKERAARAVRERVSELEAAKQSDTAAPPDALRWAASTSGSLRKKLVRVGLAPAVATPVVHYVADVLTAYIDRRTDIKPNTRKNLVRVKDEAVYFWPDTRIDRITVPDVRDWHRHLLRNFSQATVAMHVKKMRQMFADAKERGIVTGNPFLAVKAGTMSNPDRAFYVDARTYEAVARACPTDEWRRALALARWGALRVPSETNAVLWHDIDLDRKRMLIRSPKTERFPGRGERQVPIGPALYAVLAAGKPAGGVGYVLPTLRAQSQLRTGLRRIVKAAGYKPWPRLWQNLRASCETDWASRFPLHIACAWSGNTAAVAIRHYLQIPDAYFGAASSAAHNAGQDRTPMAQDNGNRPVSTGNPMEWMPSVGAEQLPLSYRQLQNYHAALHRALLKVNPTARTLERIRDGLAARPRKRGRAE